MKFFDKLFLNGVAIALLSLLFFFVTKNYVAGMFIGYLVWVIGRTAFLYLTNRYKIVKNMTTKEMEEVFSMWGIKQQTEFFFGILPSRFEPSMTENVVSYDHNGAKIKLYPNYKFSPTSCEDVAKIYRENKDYDGKLYILGKMPSKEVLLLAGKLPLNITFLSSKEVRKQLIKQNALPEKLPIKVCSKKSLSSAFSDTFAPEKAKYYFLSALFCSFYAILNVQRKWYIAFTVLLIVLGMGCVLTYLLRRHKKSN